MSAESVAPGKSAPARVAGVAVGFAFVLYIIWIGAWMLERALEKRIGWLPSPAGQSLFWLLMKLPLWVLPAVLLIRASGRRFGETMGMRPRALAIGGGVGLSLGLIAVIAKTLSHQPLLALHLSWPLFSGVLVAPIIEEITFRGAILGALAQRFHFVVANLVTALLFLGVHFPGWYFQGRLQANLTAPMGGALAVFLLGLVFGYVAQKTDSVAAAMVAHLLNNLFNA